MVRFQWRQVGTIAAFTALEALRSRLATLLAFTLLTAVLLAEFVGALALTESAAVKAALLGGLLRVFAVFVVGLFVAASQAREFADKGTEMFLALPLPRAVYYLGKLGGYALVALGVSLACGLAASLYAPPSQALLWSASLFCETLIIAAVTVLCLFTLSQVTTALSVVAAFYVLCRAIAAMQLMGHGPLVDPDSWSQRFIAATVDGIAYVLPELYRFTPSEWLVYHNSSGAALLPLLGQTAIYCLLIAGASLFDLYRKNF